MSLYTKRIGSGPTLLFVVGGNGDSTVFEQAAAQLADRYTVVLYDRAGFARSPIDAIPADRLAADVEDARELLGDEPGYVVGSSSGAIVTLELLAKYPSAVQLAVPHEPPLISVLPDRDDWLARMDRVYDLFRSDGPDVAMALFRKEVGLGGEAPTPPAAELPPVVREMFERMAFNVSFWMEHELRQYPRHELDLDALADSKGKLVLASGVESRGLLPYRPNEVLSDRLGVDVVEFPGGHLGYLQHPVEFAAQLHELLSSAAAS
ncbi:alpha/beta fold hydrolase [Kutzneria buriramensis]|uniref:Pimeloyl-ACP methyl ester carboxylesterase n=1 Tax=Kutzneria buriramensis TaxID=1045776 RepID=A0A3E0H078_9PSEU|nr:alpha/beta hydrolase [Kutzneria buriramensis]REH36218.1 pimeloyl-ACP methyl ester carboxylesterase [Kutzneria buriramensis]